MSIPKRRERCCEYRANKAEIKNKNARKAFHESLPTKQWSCLSPEKHKAMSWFCEKSVK